MREVSRKCSREPSSVLGPPDSAAVVLDTSGSSHGGPHVWVARCEPGTSDEFDAINGVVQRHEQRCASTDYKAIGIGDATRS